ncbi:MAG: hypothetical protein FWG99_12370 [Treponema sp.]|nr:hypothetical protein [Treponema sp.]
METDVHHNTCKNIIKDLLTVALSSQAAGFFEGGEGGGLKALIFLILYIIF